MPLVLRPPGQAAAPLPDRLARLGRSRRRTAVAGGWFRVAALTLAAVTVACTLDAAVHLPAVARAFLLVGTLAAVGVAFLRGVRGPGRGPVHPLAVALLLEARFPRLNDALASAVDFLTAGPHAGSDRFRRVAVLRAGNLADRHDLAAIVPTGRMWKGFWLAVLAVTVAVPLALWDTGRAALAVTRFADPFGTHPWPNQTAVEILDPTPPADGAPYRLAKGEPFALRFAVRGVVPDHAVVSVRLAGSAPADEPVPIDTAAGNPEATAAVRLDAGRVARDFAFRVTANDADTGWLEVTVAPAPKLVPFDGRPSPLIRLTYPAYTDLPAADLPDGTGVVEAVGGTRVLFRAAADRRIVSASFHNQTDLGPVRSATACAPLATLNPFAAVAAQLLADEATADVPVRVSRPDGTLLEADFVPHLPGLYTLRFTDDTGLTGVRLFDFRVFPDPAPVVSLDRPAPGKDPLTLLPTATVALKAGAEDRPFAVKTLGIEYRVGGPDAPVRTLPLADLAAAGSAYPAATGLPHGVLRPKAVGLDGTRTVPLSAFTQPDGSPPVDGDRITLRAAAADWDDRTALKEPGRSKEVEIRVLSRSSLEAEFQKELADLRPELLRLKEQQREAREKAAEVARSTADGKPKPEDAGKLGQAGQAQRQVRNRVADPTAGLRAAADQLRRTAQANDLPRSPTTDKVEAVADELGRLADQHLEAAEPLLGAARQEAEKTGPDPKKLADLLAQAEKHQKAAADGIDRLLERLEQWGGAGEVRGEARNLKDQLNRAGEQAAKAAGQGPDGKAASQLAPNEKADLGAAADKLDRAAEQAGGLVGKASRLADQKDAQAKAARAAAKEKDAAAQTDPSQADARKADADALTQAADRAAAEADALRKGVREAGGQAIPDDLRRAADELRKNRAGESAAARQSAAGRLDKLAEALTEQPPESADQLKKKQSTQQDAIDKLAADQDELRKKSKAAAAIPDPTKRAAELTKLAREQEKLKKQAELLAERLTRDRADKPAAAVRRAADRMDWAREGMERGKPPAEEQADALDQLDEAMKKLDRDRKEAEDHLTREKRDELTEQLKAIREKQQAAVAEATRIQDAAMKAKRWDRPLAASLGDLEDREKNLADELRAYAGKNLAELPVFQKLATQSAAAMDKAAAAAAERREDALTADGFDPDAEKSAGDRVGRPMQTALRRLDQILSAVKNDPAGKPGEKPEKADGGQPPADKGDGDKPGEPPAGGVPALAQLKALRAMQAEVNERTAAFAQDHPDADKLTDDERDELKDLEQAQRDVAELFDKLAPLVRPAAPAEQP